jgi:hypothetical protein
VADPGESGSDDESQYLKTGRTAGIVVMPGATFAAARDVTIIGFNDGIANEGEFGLIERVHIKTGE